MASTRMPIDPRSRAMVRHMPAIARLGGGVGDLPDLALEGGDRRGVDDDAALFVLGLVLGSCARPPAG